MAENKSSLQGKKTENKNSSIAKKRHFQKYIFPVYIVFYLCGVAYMVFSIFAISTNIQEIAQNQPNTVKTKLDTPSNQSILKRLDEQQSTGEASKNSPFTDNSKTKLKDEKGRINPLNNRTDY
jgi:hypothetical protein